MDWSSLALTFLGGALAVGGGFFGQWWSERAAVAREQRERDHEREVWARGLRYEAHVEFLSTFDAKCKAASAAKDRGEGQEAPHDWLVPLRARLQALRMLGTRETWESANVAFENLYAYVFEEPDDWQSVEFAIDEYLLAVRREFHLPPIGASGD